MEPRKSRIVISLLMVSGFFLSACQNVPSTLISASAETKAAETSKSITPEMARNLSNNCFTCHSPNGRSPGSIPNLTKLSTFEIVEKLKRFKSGEISSTVMGRLARGYTDSEINMMANAIVESKR